MLFENMSAQEKQHKNKQMGLHEAQKLLHGEGNSQQTKKPHSEWKKICAGNIANKGLISKLHQKSPYMWNIKRNDTNEVRYKAETDWQT